MVGFALISTITPIPLDSRISFKGSLIILIQERVIPGLLPVGDSICIYSNCDFDLLCVW